MSTDASIDVSPTADELEALHDKLKAYEIQLATYLSSPTAQNDPNVTALTATDIQLNVQIYNLSISTLQLVGEKAGAAVDAINAAISSLNAFVADKTKVATALGVAQAVLGFVLAVVSENPQTIISTGGTLVSTFKSL